MYRIIGADGREYGPVTRETLLQWIAESRANAQSRVRAEGAAEWQVLGSLPEFALAWGAANASRPPVAAYVPIAPVGPGVVRRTNNWAVASLIMGLLSFCGCLCCCGYVSSLLGVVFALIALAQISRAPELEEGRSLAVVGLVLSLLSMLVGVGVGLLVPLVEILHNL